EQRTATTSCISSGLQENAIRRLQKRSLRSIRRRPRSICSREKRIRAGEGSPPPDPSYFAAAAASFRSARGRQVGASASAPAVAPVRPRPRARPPRRGHRGEGGRGQPCAQAAAARFTGGGHIRGKLHRALQPASCPTKLPPNVPMMQPSNNGPQVFLPAEPVQNNEVDPEELPVSPAPAPTGKGKRTKVVSRIKLGNFKPEEDVNVVKSWLEISCDPIAAQKKDRLWERITQRYNLRRGSYPERSLRSLQSRWDIIKAEARKFASFYDDVIRENPSGMSDADKTTHAAANFAGTLKHHFAYLHCWELMKDEPKWKDPKPKSFAKSAGGDGFGEDNGRDLGDDNGSPPGSAGKRPMVGDDNGSPPGSAGKRSMVRDDNGSPPGSAGKRPMVGDDNGSPPGSAGERPVVGDDNGSPHGSSGKRPMGRDSAKAAKKKANSSAGSTSSSEYASRMQDVSLQKFSILQEEAVRKSDRFQQLACIDEKRFEEMRSYNRLLLECEQEKIRIMREKHDMDMQKEERQEDERILGIDLDACTPAQRMYYEACQEEILEKIAARRRKRQEP
ncbi:unnamed protein product, partial [Urochloa humidicola]